MKLSKAICLTGAAALTAFAAADDTPVASNVTMTQQTPGRLVTITYQLANAPAVVTLDVQTNYTENGTTKWASIGGEAVCNAQGDVWKKVGTAGATFNGTIKWRPDLSWEGHLIASGGARAVVMAWALDNTPDYMVVDLSDAAQPNTQRYYPGVDFIPGGILGRPEYHTTKLVMRKIMAKDVEWTMGSTTLETQRDAYSEKTHQVTLTNNYYIGVFEITQAQWGLIYQNTPSYWTNAADRAMRPVEQVSYNRVRTSKNNDANADYYWPVDPNPDSFLGKLRTKTGIDFDLPSEAQWEFAARAGNGDTKWGDGSGISNTDEDANLTLFGRYIYNGGKVYNGSAYVNADKSCTAANATAIVGTYAPNAWGLYDTAGNVKEHCLDWQNAIITGYCGRVNIDFDNPQNDLSGIPSGPNGNRITRGGGWANSADGCRPAHREGLAPNSTMYNTGFRVTCRGGLQ